MMTSMSNSRCLRMAIATAAGIPNCETGADTVNAAPVSHTWPAAMPSRAMSRQAANTAAASASHSICCRISRPPARYRTASDTTTAAMNPPLTTASPVKVPMGTARKTGARFLTPSGLG